MLFENLMSRDCPTNLVKAGVYKKRRNSKALIDSGISKFHYEVVRKPEMLSWLILEDFNPDLSNGTERLYVIAQG